MRKVEDVMLLQRKKACRLACQVDYFVAHSTSYAIICELVDSADTFCLQSGTVTLVKSSTNATVCTLAYHLGRERLLLRRSNAECRPASVARALGMAKTGAFAYAARRAQRLRMLAGPWAELIAIHGHAYASPDII